MQGLEYVALSEMFDEVDSIAMNEELDMCIDELIDDNASEL